MLSSAERRWPIPRSLPLALRPVIRLLIGLVAIATVASPSSARADLALVFGPQSEPARAWLAARDFRFELDADDEDSARFRLDERGLHLDTLERANPILAIGTVHVEAPATLTVDWGVGRYPPGANWDDGVNNEAIMVMVQFGTEKLSGGFFLPDRPYFIGFFLCDAGQRDVYLTGRSYREQGRYICVDGPAEGQAVRTVIDLAAAFEAAFGKPATLPVTGVAIESDTTQVDGDGRASAWITSIGVRTRVQ